MAPETFVKTWPRSEATSFFNGAFACDNVGKTYLELKERGVEFVGEPKEESWGAFAIFKDPDDPADYEIAQIIDQVVGVAFGGVALAWVFRRA